jgi:hypothetical protein
MRSKHARRAEHLLQVQITKEISTECPLKDIRVTRSNYLNWAHTCMSNCLLCIQSDTYVPG